MDKLTEINKAIQHYRFKSLWEGETSCLFFYNLCNRIRKSVGLRPFTTEELDNGWSYRVILHEEYNVAREEFLNFCIGLW